MRFALILGVGCSQVEVDPDLDGWESEPVEGLALMGEWYGDGDDLAVTLRDSGTTAWVLSLMTDHRYASDMDSLSGISHDEGTWWTSGESPRWGFFVHSSESDYRVLRGVAELRDGVLIVDLVDESNAPATLETGVGSSSQGSESVSLFRRVEVQ